MRIRECKSCEGDGFIYVNCGCREAMCPHMSVFGEPTDPQPGLYGKFWVRRTDGSSAREAKHAACTYFVLDWDHDPFAVPAARAYADACASTYPELAADLRKLADQHWARWREARLKGTLCAECQTHEAVGSWRCVIGPSLVDVYVCHACTPKADYIVPGTWRRLDGTREP